LIFCNHHHLYPLLLRRARENVNQAVDSAKAGADKLAGKADKAIKDVKGKLNIDEAANQAEKVVDKAADKTKKGTDNTRDATKSGIEAVRDTGNRVQDTR
jgi:hypothetical protein